MNNYGQSPFSRHEGFEYNPLATNVILVTSLEEALSRTTAYNSDMVYFHQDLDVMYRIKVDRQGRKTWTQLNIVAPDPNTMKPVTFADFKVFDNRLKAIENKLKMEVNSNEQFNEQRPVQPGTTGATE